MKNISAICMALCLCFMCSCTSESLYINKGTADYACDEAYNKGYNQGYEDGIEYVSSYARDNAYDWDVYMKIDDIEDAIYDYFEDIPYVDADDVKDAIIHEHKHYSLKDLADELLPSVK